MRRATMAERATRKLLADYGIDLRTPPAIERFARVNGVSIEEVTRAVDNVYELCADRGVNPTTEAIVDALGTVAAFHKAGEEMRGAQ